MEDEDVVTRSGSEREEEKKRGYKDIHDGDDGTKEKENVGSLSFTRLSAHVWSCQTITKQTRGRKRKRLDWKETEINPFHDHLHYQDDHECRWPSFVVRERRRSWRYDVQDHHKRRIP